MEEEARIILREAPEVETTLAQNRAILVHVRLSALGGVELVGPIRGMVFEGFDLLISLGRALSRLCRVVFDHQAQPLPRAFADDLFSCVHALVTMEV